MVPGRSKRVLKTWLSHWDAAWCTAIAVVRYGGVHRFRERRHRTVERRGYRVVMDPFHVVRLAGQSLELCRRRVQQYGSGPPRHPATCSTTRLPDPFRRRGPASPTNIGTDLGAVRRRQAFVSPATVMGPPGPVFCHGSWDHRSASYGTTRRVLTPAGSGRLFDLHVLFAGMEVADDGVPGGRRG